MKNLLLVIPFIIGLIFGANDKTPIPIFGAPTVNGVGTRYERTILPETDSTYELGTSTKAWLRINSDEYCLTADSCITSWPAGGPGGGEWPFTPATNFGTPVQSTTTPLWLNGTYYSLFASTTVVFGTSTDIYAIATPASPSAGAMRVWVETFAGKEFLKTKNSDGNAFTVHRDNVFVARNNTGSTINKGQVVYVSGQLGNSRPTIALADSDAEATMPSVGIAYEDIADGADGWIMQTGLIDGIDTATAGGAAGDNVYVSGTAGQFTTTRPSVPSFTQPVGVILTSHGSNGKLFVNVPPIQRFGLFTSGSIPFANSDGLLAQNNANLNWNDTLTLLTANKATTTTGFTSSGNTWLTTMTSALLQTGSDGLVSEYAGTSCTNQFVRSLSALGIATCATVTSTDVDSSITPSARTITVAGTANQITSSAGAQDLSANRTWTLSLPNHVIFPSSFVAALGTTTNATSTNLDITTRLGIPNGTAPTAANNGDIAHDTTANQLIMGNNVVAQAKRVIWSVTIASTSPAFIDASTTPIAVRPYGYTMTNIYCYTQGPAGTEAKTISILHTAAGTATETIFCADSVTQDDGSINNATVTASEKMKILFGNVSGSPDYVTITVYGTITRE